MFRGGFNGFRVGIRDLGHQFKGLGWALGSRAAVMGMAIMEFRYPSEHSALATR